jgi:hypothetical protein
MARITALGWALRHPSRASFVLLEQDELEPAEKSDA